jgi:SAM-dependent methyltransferase
MSTEHLKFNGASLVQARGGRFGEKVFVCVNGVRHYVPTADRLADYGLAWPDSLQQVPDTVLASFRAGGWLPRIFPASQDARAINDSSTMREFLSAELHGVGLEVGAGASPYPVPLRCTVLYGDRMSHEQLLAERYEGQEEADLVRPDMLTDFSALAGVADESLDFVIGCHVIEHVFDPIGSIVHAHRVLKPGGTLILVVPDKSRTFDRDRPVTKLEHLILDHKAPDSKRDYAHYEEFYSLAFKTEVDQLRLKADYEFRRRGDLHVHVWDHPAFAELVDWVAGNLVEWSSVASHAPRGNAEDIEFYVVLRK